MPGSATLDSDILVDDLVDLVDELRQDLNTDMGVRAFDVFAVTRTWASGTIGEGASIEVEVELTPQPLVKPYSSPAGLGYDLTPCGIDEAGFVMVKEISLSYTQAEITGKTVVGEIEQSLPAGIEFVIRIREAHGQEQSYRDFKIDGPPYPDRERDIGWRLRLLRAEDSV